MVEKDFIQCNVNIFETLMLWCEKRIKNLKVMMCQLWKKLPHCIPPKNTRRRSRASAASR